MATAPSTLTDPPPESIWQSPLVPAALGLTAGIVLDRYAAVPLAFSLVGALLCLLCWLITRAGSQRNLSLLYLALAGVAFAAAYHHYRRDVYAPDDIGNLAPAQPHPVQLRGLLDEEPFSLPAPPPDCLRSFPQTEFTTTVLRVTHLRQRDDWAEVSGRVRLRAAGKLAGLHVGDEVEVVGQLSAIAGPANPGEFDQASYWRDRGVRARVVVKTADGVTRLARGWSGSPRGWLAVVRGWGQDVFARTLPPRSRGVAMALVLGEGAPMTAADWEKYLRTGVLHVLAISGQHLVVVAFVLWWVLRRLGVRQRHGAWIVAVVILGYALLTGGRPPALRSAVAVCAVCGALVLRRQMVPANVFALAWIVVALVNPTDLFTAGCQLSFLSVAVLSWGTRGWFATERDPLEKLFDESRPLWLRGLRGLGWKLLEVYAISLAVWLAVTPLAVARYHVVPSFGIPLGPPLTLLCSVALIAGFFLLAAAAVCPLLVTPAAWVLDHCLAACEFLVDRSADWPVSRVYVGDIPEWWLWVFYGALLAGLTQQPLRKRWRWGATAGLGWLCVGLLCGAARGPGDELRCTFLAVGHGGCTVLETPDGRTLLYDAGAIGGPDVTRRTIAPFLWSRGVRRIDEVFLSHADLDHFNGLVQLTDRFAVGQVSYTPTFRDKPTDAVRCVLKVLGERRIPVRMVKAGDRLTAGDVSLEVLHPPAATLGTNENARSLVLRVRHAGHTLLLTGDLEGAGLERVLQLPRERIDVFMAPHHGSRLVNTPDLANWARPRVVISCQGPPRWAANVREPYSRTRAHFLGTWPDGAITVRSHASGLIVETFLSKQRIAVRSGARGD